MGALILIGLAIILLAAIVVTVIGAHVVRKYPDRNDPDRNALRYTLPAALCVGAILGGAVACIVGFVGLLVVGA